MKKVEWVSYIDLEKSREAEIKILFSCKVEFYYPKNLGNFNDLSEELKSRSKTAKIKNSDNEFLEDTYSIENDLSKFESSYGEKSKKNRLIVMDHVSGLADTSKKFEKFLTVAHNFNYTYDYVFHIIYPEKVIRKSIISQTNIFNIFPASVPLSSVQKILESVCIRKTRKHIPQASLWISRLFTELANRNERAYLTLDCSGINRDGSARFRTKADNPDFQTCYFNVLNDKQSYNEL